MLYDGEEKSALQVAKNLLAIAVSLASEPQNVADAVELNLRGGGTANQLEHIQRHVEILKGRILSKTLKGE